MRALILGAVLALSKPAFAAGLPNPLTPFTPPKSAVGTSSISAGVQAITLDDLKAALADANAQTPPDTRHAQCWGALIPFVENYQAASILPTKPGLALLAQKTFDLQQAAGKPLIPDSIVTACALTVSDLKLDVAKLAGFLGIQAIVLPKLPVLP